MHATPQKKNSNTGSKTFRMAILAMITNVTVIVGTFLYLSYDTNWSNTNLYDTNPNHANIPDNSQKNANTAYTTDNTAIPATTAPTNAGGEKSHPSAKKHAQKQLSNPVAEYHITVVLDEKQKKLHGKQVVTWTNPGKKVVDTLYFHLYPNAFRSNKTTFNLESGGKLRNDKRTGNGIGWIDIQQLQTDEGADLIRRTRFVQPDDNNVHDYTLWQVRLHEPVQPNEQITLHLQFEVQLPEVYARMGYSGDFVMAGQWFPKIAAYEPQGRRGRTEEGWNLHQYHGNSEFYADFANFSVRINVPDNYIVAATGFPTRPAEKRQNRKTYHYYAEDVHDFAWAASPHFIYTEDPFSGERIPGVKIKLYLDPAHEKLKDRYLYAAKQSLVHYAKWFGPYPYPTLSIVIPPPGGNGAGGMEYPTLITGWAADETEPDMELERVIVHEIGHQYWYGIVATNEFEEAWLDEGFTSYAEDKVMKAVYGIDSPHMLEASYMTSPVPLKMPAWYYGNHDIYAENVYLRAKLVLLDIERKIGEDLMKKVLQTYFRKWQFNHPSTEDFQHVLEEVTKKPWDDYFRQFVYGGRMVDHAVKSIEIKESVNRGRTGNKEKTYENRIVVESRDGTNGEVMILMRFEDGSEKWVAWDGKNGRAEFRIASRSPVRWVLVDPLHAHILEHKYINNYMKAGIDTEQKIRWQYSAAKIIESLLRWLAW